MAESLYDKLITFNVYKQEPTVKDMTSLFNGRVGDQGVRLAVRWVQGEPGTLQEVDVINRNMFGSVHLMVGNGIPDGNGDINMDVDASGIDIDSDPANNLPHGITVFRLPQEAFPKDGFAKGYFALKDNLGNVWSSIDVWFKVKGGTPYLAAKVKYFSDEWNTFIAMAKKQNDDFANEMRDAYNQQVTDAQNALTRATANLSSLAGTAGNIEAQITAQDIITRPEYDKLANQISDTLSKMNLNVNTKYSTLDDIQKALPNGADGLFVTEDGYQAIFRNGKWVKGPLFQAAGLSDEVNNKIDSSYISTVADNFVDNATFSKGLEGFSTYGTSQHSTLGVNQIDGTNWLVINADQTNSQYGGFSFDIDTKKHTDIDEYPLLLSLLMFSSTRNQFNIVIRYCDADGKEIYPKQALESVLSISAMSYKMFQESFTLNQKIASCDHINIAITTLNGFSGLIRVKSLKVTDAFDQDLLQAKHKLFDGELLADGSFSANKVPNQIQSFATVNSSYSIVTIGNKNFLKVSENDQSTNNKGFSIMIRPSDYFKNPYLFQQSILLTGSVVGSIKTRFQTVVRYLDDAWNVLNTNVQYGPVIDVNGDLSSFAVPIQLDAAYADCSQIAITLSSIPNSINNVYFTDLSCRLLKKNSIEEHDIDNTKAIANVKAKSSDEILDDGFFENGADQYIIGDFTSNDKQKYSVVQHDRLNWLSITETDTTTTGKGFSRRIHLADYPNILEERLKLKLLVWSTANVTFDVHINYMDAAYSVLKTTGIARVTTSFNQIKAKSFEFQLENIENVTDVVIVFSAIGNTIGTTQFAALSLRPTYSEYPDHGLPIVELNDVSSPNAVSQMTDTNQVILDFKLHRNGTVTSGYTQSKWQGNSSVSFDKKPYRLKLFSDIALKNKLKINALPSWNADNKFNLKANYNDATFARNVVNARIVRDVMETRTDLPSELAKSTADGQIDGFPVEVYCNGIYHGIHTFNLTKDCFGKAKYAFEASNYSDLTKFKKVPANADELFTKSNFDMVTPDDPDDTLKQSLTSLLTLCVNATDNDFKTNISSQMDVNSLIDGIILQNLFASTDWVGKNELFITFDGKKWFYNLYDLDSTWGIGWEGTVNPAVTSIQGTDHGLFGRVLKLYEPEIKKRYADLRKWLTPNYVLNQFRAFMNSVGQENYERDYELWKEPHFKDQTFAQLKSSVFNQFSVCDKAWLD